ncbi:MAG: G protein-coupled receptor family protein, partial [Marinobacter sp.]
TAAAYLLAQNGTFKGKDHHKNKSPQGRNGGGNNRSKSNDGKRGNRPSPRNGRQNDRKRNNGRSKSKQPEWMTTAPKSGDPSTKTVDGRTYHWCAKCRYGKGRWTPSHGTAEHKGKQNDSPPKNNAAATLAFVDDDFDAAAWVVEVPQYVSLLITIDALFRDFPAFFWPLAILFVSCAFPLHVVIDGFTNACIISLNWIAAQGNVGSTLILWSMAIGLSLATLKLLPSAILRKHRSTPTLWRFPAPTTIFKTILFVVCWLAHSLYWLLVPTRTNDAVAPTPPQIRRHLHGPRPRPRPNSPPLVNCSNCNARLPKCDIVFPARLCHRCLKKQNKKFRRENFPLFRSDDPTPTHRNAGRNLSNPFFDEPTCNLAEATPPCAQCHSIPCNCPSPPVARQLFPTAPIDLLTIDAITHAPSLDQILAFYFRNCFNPPSNNETVWVLSERTRMHDCGIRSAQEFLAHLPVLSMRRINMGLPTLVDSSAMERTIGYAMQNIDSASLPKLGDTLQAVFDQFHVHYDLPNDWIEQTARLLQHIGIANMADFISSTLEIPLLLAQSELPSLELLIRHACNRYVVNRIYPELL